MTTSAQGVQQHQSPSDGALVQQVLNDTGDDPDQLPVMQHAMLRTYGAWERAGAKGRIEREHYNSIGGIEQAVDWLRLQLWSWLP